MTIALIERGSTEVSRDAWNDISGDPHFWSLVDQRILKVSQVSGRRMQLSAGCFVGQAVVGGHNIQITEKRPGALATLLSFATGQSFRVERVQGPKSDLGPLIVLLIDHYLTALRKYVSRGREARYTRRSFQGSLVGGRLNITKTLRLRARGLKHVLAYDKDVLQRNTIKNRLLLAATHEVETLAGLVDIPQEQLATARGLSMIFDDCRDEEVLFGRRRRFFDDAERLIQDGDRDSDLLSLASIVLAHQSFEPSVAPSGRLPRAWFLNLETLFETAVRSILSTIIGGSVKTGAVDHRNIFGEMARRYEANPDLVIRSGMTISAIGDVKYKVWQGFASEDDLYQLLVHMHTATFGSKTAFLIFPHEEFASVRLGLSTTGANTWVFAVNLFELRADLEKALEVMAVPRSAPQVTAA
jgi:5-methylcytosine-specific restriction endonuclease McrBC regulatory subunit McrC